MLQVYPAACCYCYSYCATYKRNLTSPECQLVTKRRCIKQETLVLPMEPSLLWHCCLCCHLQADRQDCCLIVTTGGTGPAPRDVTPEATSAVCERMLPGYGEQMRAISLKYVPTAVLSRQTAGVQQRLIVRLTWLLSSAAVSRPTSISSMCNSMYGC